jgi:hypothetical protein
VEREVEKQARTLRGDRACVFLNDVHCETAREKVPSALLLFVHVPENVQ